MAKNTDVGRKREQMGNAGGYRQGEEEARGDRKGNCTCRGGNVCSSSGGAPRRGNRNSVCHGNFGEKMSGFVNWHISERGHAHLELHQLEDALDLLLELLVVLLLIRSLRRHVPKDFTATRRCREGEVRARGQLGKREDYTITKELTSNSQGNKKG
jgi:hypothetical protein